MSPKRALFSSTVMRVASAALAFLNGIVLARVLGPDTYGQYVLILSWISLAYFTSTAGLPTLLLRETSLSNAARDDALSKGVVIFALYIFGGLLVLCGLAYGVASALPGVDLAVEGQGGLAWAIVLFWGLSILFENATRGLGHTTMGQVAELILRPGLGLVLFLGVAMLHGAGLADENDALLALFAATLATAGFSAAVFWRIMRQRWQTTQARFIWRDWLHGTLHNSVTNILLAMTLQVSFLVIGALAGEGDLGLYRAGYQLSIVAGIGLLAAKAVVGPQIGRSLRDPSTAPPAQVVRQAIATCLAFSLPLSAVLLIFPGTVMELVYGASYAGIETTVRILALGVIANSFFGPIDVALQVARRDRLMMAAALARIVIHIGLLYLLTLPFGIAGAAAAHAIALVVWCGIMLGATLVRPLRPPPAP